MPANKIKVTKAMLKAPLFSGLSIPDKKKLLQARIFAAQQRARMKKKSRVSGKALFEGTVGTRNAMGIMQDLRLIGGSARNPNSAIAQKMVTIFSYMRALPFETIGSDHRALVGAAKKVVTAQHKNKPLSFTPKEKKAVDYYYESALRARL